MRTSAIALIAVIMMATPSCGKPGPPGDPDLAYTRDAWFKLNDGKAGPVVPAEQIKNTTIQGVHVGMHLETALAQLSSRAKLASFDRLEGSTRPWEHVYNAYRFKPYLLPRDDLSHLHESSGRDRRYPPTLKIYATQVGPHQIVTGLTYRYVGKLDGNGPLKTPTATFLSPSNGTDAPTYLYAPTRDMVDYDLLTAMDFCGGRGEFTLESPSPGYGGSPIACQHLRLPDHPFIYARSFANGLAKVVIRDVPTGRAFITSLDEVKDQ